MSGWIALYRAGEGLLKGKGRRHCMEENREGLWGNQKWEMVQ
jgi:hypothetical protein